MHSTVEVSKEKSNKEGKVISFINMKGGVGKTTLTVNLADVLADQGFNILVIDMDPQFNSTQTLLLHKIMLSKTTNQTQKSDTDAEIENEIQEEESSTQIYNELVKKNSTVLQLFASTSIVEKSKIIYKIKSKLDLIPGDLTLAKEISGDTSNKVELIMDFIEKNTLKSQYDYIFIDCPPTWSILTHSSLFTSDYYIIPSKVDLYSSIGIKLLEQQVYEKITNTTTYKKMGLDLKNLGIIFSLVHRNIQAEKIRTKKLKESFSNLPFFDSTLPHMPSVPSKFIVYSDAKEQVKYTQLINSIDNIAAELVSKTTTEKGD